MYALNAVLCLIFGIIIYFYQNFLKSMSFAAYNPSDSILMSVFFILAIFFFILEFRMYKKTKK